MENNHSARFLQRAKELHDAWDAGFGVAVLDVVDAYNWRLTLVTGGWSENERLVPTITLDDGSLDMFYYTCWELSARGGLHTFVMGNMPEILKR